MESGKLTFYLDEEFSLVTVTKYLKCPILNQHVLIKLILIEKCVNCACLYLLKN